ncbi:MAG: 30S ribosomal protein S5 [Nanoarchaeota archaeon]
MKEEQKEETFTPLERWIPKTSIGKAVKKGELTDLNIILNKGEKILENEIIDTLLPNLSTDLLEVGQSKGKFGGGKKSIWRQTQKKTKEGNKIRFSACAIVGNQDGFVGLGRGSSRETMPARDKATRQAKLQIIKVRRGCGSWKCGCGEPHSIPFKVSGSVGSVTINLMPAPKGTGLVIEKECAKILKFAGIKDIHTKAYGNKRTKINLVYACFDALKELSKVKMPNDYNKKAGVLSGNEQH